MQAGDFATVHKLAGADPALVNATNQECFGATPLIHAVNADNRAMIDLLLELGADIDGRSDWWAGGFGVLDSATDETAAYLLGRGATLTPHAAARLGRLDELRVMLGAQPSLVNARGGDGQLPLHFARTTAIADLLLERGAIIDATDIDHASTAAEWLSDSRPEVAAHLVARGARADVFLAARIGDVALLDRLLKQEPGGVRARVSRERFPVPPPAAGHIYLYTIGEGATLLHAAAGTNQAGVIRALAGRGAEVNARGGYDDGTPLHTAAWRDGVDAAGALLDVGADPNLPSGPMHQNEPLGWAIVGGAKRAVRLLLERGVRPGPHHIEDARAGADGRFRCFNRDRPIEAWRSIARLIGA